MYITKNVMYLYFLSLCLRPDITVMVDWALKISYLSLSALHVPTRTHTYNTNMDAGSQIVLTMKETRREHTHKKLLKKPLKETKQKSNGMRREKQDDFLAVAGRGR